jgi:thiamine biosynthesis lipoprotein
VTRRRTLRLLAGISGLALSAPFGGEALASQNTADSSLHTWQGIVLGAQASLAIYHPDRDKARGLIAAALAEIERLERIFSLYRPDSALVQLNASGRLDHPPLELVALLGRAKQWSERTGGAFDVTVQPLWSLYRDHFAAARPAPEGPGAEALAAARRLVDHRAVAVEPRRIELARRGMAVTLNGIAQGYITDRVAELLRAEGLGHVLVDLGELRALGRHPDGRAWRVGLADPLEPDRLRATLAIDERAVATSAATGLQFDAAGRFHHVLNPRTSRPGAGLLAASVVAEQASDADACSTAILASRDALAALLIDPPASLSKIVTTEPDGSLQQIDLKVRSTASSPNPETDSATR